MNTRQLLSVGIDIGTTTTQVIFSRLEPGQPCGSVAGAALRIHQTRN